MSEEKQIPTQEKDKRKSLEPREQKAEDRVVRILSKDIEGKTKLYPGLTKVKGISWGISNSVCRKLGIDKNKKIGALSEKEIEKIEAFLKNPEIPFHLKNRKKDFETGHDSHLIGSDLDLRREFDIKRLKKIKSYRGIRHLSGQPTRGQRTRSHFRVNRRRGSGIKRKKEGGAAKPAMGMEGKNQGKSK